MDWMIRILTGDLYYTIPLLLTIWTTWRWFRPSSCIDGNKMNHHQQHGIQRQQQQQHHEIQVQQQHETQRQYEKESFLQRAGSHYGYASSPMGHIDTWRCRELPALYNHPHHDNNEIYLDYAGSALPWQSQLHAASQQLWANPHSQIGPTASRTVQHMERVRQQLLELWDATPELHHHHPGYQLYFTSGTTEALRMVAERFAFTPHKSLFVCPAASHTSVLGMRECALRAGASFRVMHGMQEMQQPTAPSLVVLPLECNFSGDRLSPKVCQAFVEHPAWCVGLDMAKAVCTGPVSLKEWNPDFAVVSFYKLFGAPTGLGALFVRNKSPLADMLHSQRAYFGGGMVQVVVPARDYVVRKTAPQMTLGGGTCHFRGICELEYGLETLQKLGGMPAIRNHTAVLARELVRRLRLLKHKSTDRAAIVLYGAWAQQEKDECCPGPTVTFNVVRDDGKTHVGYHEIAQLAALHSPPLQFRVGCFCNPGACQQALGWSDDEVISNFEQLGHVCGDDVDLIEGKPTGAVRISLGKDSMWEDIDALIRFLERVYVQKEPQEEIYRDRRKPAKEMILKELYVFPIKSCAAQSVTRWPVVHGQLWMDRAFCLVNASGQALRLSTHPNMAYIRPIVSYETNEMTVTAPGMAPLVLPLLQDEEHTDPNAIRVCGSHECRGIAWGDTLAARWFSDFLKVPCWLARHSSTTAKGTVSSFANEQPILMIRQNAVDAINVILQGQGRRPVSSQHFRPNIVVQVTSSENDDADEHQQWLYDGKIHWQVVGPCARCNMVDLDPTSGTKDGHTLRALAEYHLQRRRRGRLTFGVFLRQVERVESSEEKIWMQVGRYFVTTKVEPEEC